MKSLQMRYHGPFVQNAIISVVVAFTAGIYVALNILGAGGGRPDSFHVTSTINAIATAFWCATSCLGPTILNQFGLAYCTCYAAMTYILYVGSLWYFDKVGGTGFPYAIGVLNGIGVALLFVCAGFVQMAYPEEDEKGLYVVLGFTFQALGSVVGSIIPLLINRNNIESTAGVPSAVYIAFIVIFAVMMVLALFLLPPEKLTRNDGSALVFPETRPFLVELKSNLKAFWDWKLLLMIPACFPAEAFLVYSGSTNAYHNNLRTRCLLGFIAVVIQVPFGIVLYWILDHKTWRRRTRAFGALAYVGIPLMGAWIWEMVRVHNYNRADPPEVKMDWTDDGFVAIFFLFNLNWTAGSLWQYLIVWWLGAMSNDPVKVSHYAGVWRAFLAAGEAIMFGADVVATPYQTESAIFFSMYAAGILILGYLAYYHISDTMYFKEERVVVPNHIIGELVDGDKRVSVAVAVHSIDGPDADTANNVNTTGLVALDKKA